MTFLSKIQHPIFFIGQDRLVKSKRLMNKKIRTYNAEIRGSTDVDFILKKRDKISLLKLIIKDMEELIEAI
jgi:hypothetical protein